MDKTRKKNIRRILAFFCALVIVGLLAAMPLLAKTEEETEGPQASILSGSAVSGNISTELIGGGTLAEDDAVTVSVPAAVKECKKLSFSRRTMGVETARLADVGRVATGEGDAVCRRRTQGGRYLLKMEIRVLFQKTVYLHLVFFN